MATTAQPMLNGCVHRVDSINIPSTSSNLNFKAFPSLPCRLTVKIPHFCSSFYQKENQFFEFLGELQSVKWKKKVSSGINNIRASSYASGDSQSNRQQGVSSPYSSSPASFSSPGEQKKRLAVFVSGGGSNFKAIQNSISRGKLRGDVVVVVTDKPECGGALFALEHNIPVLAFPQSSKFAPDGVSPLELVEQLRSFQVEYVVLAGYLKLIPQELVSAFPKSILNIHPALLPAFGGKGYYGMRVHEGVLKAGARFSGPTVHFVDEKYDNGPIIAQRTVPVLPYDTPKELQSRVLAEEHKLYSYVLAAICEDRIVWREDGIPLIRRVDTDDCFE